MPTTALVIEDDDLMRVSLVAALASADVDVVASAKTSAEALELAHTLFPQVALVDLHLGRGPTGVDVAHELRKNDPRIGIVFLTSFEDPRLIAETKPLPQGSQYLLKKDVGSIDEIAEAITASLEGKNRRISTELPSNMSQLSDVQLETLRLVAQGLSNTEIARRRQVTEKSIEASITRLLKSLNIPRDEGSNQRVQLARLYFESQGLSSHE
ncbi:two-component system nitrate/nitrite response regulator NarL [Aurantimicrobium minutum]|uniref:response regulator transcription factor n=1 Tax=Aurantimicrobium minutum TaxID=708131 RepID=UPI002473E687|nr:response regulator transcription factor [Aurantimicrobium minutum]MDH6409962.1 two-component system nitrate/nitrite response regulator NarL [Aurantimicrobium minutum]MDH6424157.1 two-component system nitrate/nitrite response regulator NarL [Aurantimicrobium minutum]